MLATFRLIYVNISWYWYWLDTSAIGLIFCFYPPSLGCSPLKCSKLFGGGLKNMPQTCSMKNMQYETCLNFFVLIVTSVYRLKVLVS